MSSKGSDEESQDDTTWRGVRAIVERYRDEPNRCTIVPTGTDEEERLTTWITAEAPFYVDLWESR